MFHGHVDHRDDTTMSLDAEQKRRLTEAKRERQLALARGDVRAVHACNAVIAALRRDAQRRP